MIQTFFKWILGIALGLILILFLAGSILQWKYDSKVEREYKPSGDFSDIGTHRIHYEKKGTGDFTFVLVAGLGETMQTWSEIEDELEKRGVVFTYDRSGLGHSESGVLPRSVDHIATELQHVLENENVTKPYLLVGHSVGGFIARYFAKKYPQDVMGLFLIDPFPEMGKEELGEWPISYRLMNWSFRKLSWSGIPYVLLPDPPHPLYKTSKAIATYGEEAYAEDISLAEFGKLDKEVSDLPIYILTAAKTGARHSDLPLKWHRAIFAKYSNAINKHLVVESGHHIHRDKPDLVMESLNEFVNQLATQ